jgi:hypothetical protein
MHPSHRTPTDRVERFVPVLVTNAELVVVDDDLGLMAASLETGNIPATPSAVSTDILILKHPFPTPEGLKRDLRDEHNPSPSPEHWSQLHKESIFVVRASALTKFIAGGYRDYLRDVEHASK